MQLFIILFIFHEWCQLVTSFYQLMLRLLQFPFFSGLLFVKAHMSLSSFINSLRDEYTIFLSASFCSDAIFGSFVEWSNIMFWIIHVFLLSYYALNLHIKLLCNLLFQNESKTLFLIQRLQKVINGLSSSVTTSATKIL